MQRFDLNLLRVLVSLHEAESVSKGAESLGLSQPAMSLALQRLRRTLNDPLFVRTSRGMRPTSHCSEIVVAAKRALGMVEAEVLKSAGFDPTTAQRTFSLCMNDIGEMALLPQIMFHLTKHAPSCDVRCETLLTRELEPALESGQVDLTIGYHPDLERSSLFVQRLFSASFVCLVRRGHPRVSGERIPLRTFLELSHVVVRPQGRSNELFEAVLKKQGLRRRIHLSLPHFMSVPAIVAHTDFVATVPSTVAHYFTRLDGIQIVQPPISVGRYAIKQHWHPRFQHDPAVRWLREQMVQLFSTHPGAQ